MPTCAPIPAARPPEPQRASSSTSTASWRWSPPCPPSASGYFSPSSPSSPMRVKTPSGNQRACSQSRACGRSSRATKRADRRPQLLVLGGEGPAGRAARAHSFFRSMPKTPRMTCFCSCLPCREPRKSPTWSSGDSDCGGRPAGLGARSSGRGHVVGDRGRRRRVGGRGLRHPRGEHLARGLAPPGACRTSPTAATPGRRRRRRRRAPCWPRAPRRRVWTTGVGHAALVEHRHRGLADARATAAAPRGRRSPTAGTSTRSPCSAFASSGVKARSACWTRIAELAEDVARDVLRRLGDEEDADALGADEAHGPRRPRRRTRRSRR